VNAGVIALGLIVFGWLRRRARRGAGAVVAEANEIGQLASLPQGIPGVQWAMTPTQQEAYWRYMGRGETPSMQTAGTVTRGTVSPQTSILKPGGVLQTVRVPLALGWPVPWAAPAGGWRLPGSSVPVKPGGPAGLILPPQPVPPGQPTPQSAVQSNSPWLLREFAFAHAWSDSRWVQPASALNPWSPALYSGYIATVNVPVAPLERA
jgi:hypothetical protein